MSGTGYQHIGAFKGNGRVQKEFGLILEAGNQLVSFGPTLLGLWPVVGRQFLYLYS